MDWAREERGETSLPALFAAEDCGDDGEEAGGEEELYGPPHHASKPRGLIGGVRRERAKNRQETAEECPHRGPTDEEEKDEKHQNQEQEGVHI